MDAEKFLAENTFYCKPLRCWMSPGACEQIRSRPEKHEGGFGYDPLMPHACKSCDWENMQAKGCEQKEEATPDLLESLELKDKSEVAQVKEEKDVAEKTIAEKLKEIRGDRNQKEVSEIIDVHSSAWSAWERGKSRPGQAARKAIKEKFGLDLGVSEPECAVRVTKPKIEELKSVSGFTGLKQSGPTLHIDFSQVPDGQKIFDGIVQSAERAFRTPQMHAAWILSHVIEEEQNA